MGEKTKQESSNTLISFPLESCTVQVTEHLMVAVLSSAMPQSEFCDVAKASWRICQDLHTCGWQRYCLELSSGDSWVSACTQRGGCVLSEYIGLI